MFVFTAGTGMPYWYGDAQAYATAMAERGFVAVSVNYDNADYTCNCTQLATKTAQVYDVTDPGSAINAVCALPKADCGRGIVVAGFSQGAHLANLAKDYDSRVEAAFLQGNGYTASTVCDLQACLLDGVTALETHRMRSVIGAHDDYFGCSPEGSYPYDGVRAQQEGTTGISCGPSALQCIQGDGSGWYIVETSETAAGYDGHCFHFGYFYCYTPMDATYLNGTADWCLNPSMDWLASFGDTSPSCGDATCGAGEDACSCPVDCGSPPPSRPPATTAPTTTATATPTAPTSTATATRCASTSARSGSTSTTAPPPAGRTAAPRPAPPALSSSPPRPSSRRAASSPRSAATPNVDALMGIDE